MKPSRTFQSGMTLIEILISMVIGIFLLGGLIQIFSSSKQTYRVQDAMSQLLESGRFATETLKNDIRMAGNLGCNSQATVTNTVTETYLTKFSEGITGHEYTGDIPDDTENDPDDADFTDWTPNINSDVTAVSNTPNRNSDIITIRRARTDSSYSVASHPPPSTSNVQLNEEVSNFDCATVIVNNCSSATIFQVTSGETDNDLSHDIGGGCSPGNNKDDLGRQFAANEPLYRIDTITYYINDFDDTTPTLYRRVNGRAEPLVEGITQMQILYGVDSDSPNDSIANYYTTADHIGPTNPQDWNQVVSVRITLTVRTLEDNLAGNNADGTDNASGRFTREFTTTIGIRNRLP